MPVRLTCSTTASPLDVIAIEVTGRRHIDGFVIDCDDVRGATDTLATIRNGRSNKLSVVFAVLNGQTSDSAAVEAGANFVMGKPVRSQIRNPSVLHGRANFEEMGRCPRADFPKPAGCAPIPLRGGDAINVVPRYTVSPSQREWLNCPIGLPIGAMKTCAQQPGAPHAKSPRGDFAWYNLCRVHKSLRVTPTTEAGIANHIWTIEELLFPSGQQP
jgi:hypothetical protein